MPHYYYGLGRINYLRAGRCCEDRTIVSLKHPIDNMKLQSALAIALSASSAFALSIPREEASTAALEQLFTLELAPGETKQVTEAEKWELHNVGRAL